MVLPVGTKLERVWARRSFHGALKRCGRRLEISGPTEDGLRRYLAPFPIATFAGSAAMLANSSFGPPSVTRNGELGRNESFAFSSARDRRATRPGWRIIARATAVG